MASFLTNGQLFVGTQNVSAANAPSLPRDEAWQVKVRLQGCDWQRGEVCGSMEALNVPSAESSQVVTFWEGEVIDNFNHSFFTSQWEASRESDLEHWAKFASFAPLEAAVRKDGGHTLNLQHYSHVFMRWKEKFFVNVGSDCGLTIAGFYYVSCRRSDGRIVGFYFDPNSSPFQKLELEPSLEGRSGYSFGAYNLQ